MPAWKAILHSRAWASRARARRGLPPAVPARSLRSRGLCIHVSYVLGKRQLAVPRFSLGEHEQQAEDQRNLIHCQLIAQQSLTNTVKEPHWVLHTHATAHHEPQVGVVLTLRRQRIFAQVAVRFIDLRHAQFLAVVALSRAIELTGVEPHGVALVGPR